MPRPRSLKPSYCHHKASNRAFVTIAGQRRYLGPYGSQASRDAYDTAVAEWISKGRPSAMTVVAAGDVILVKHVVLAFWQHAETTYIDDAGKLTVEADNFRRVLRIVRRLYGDAPGENFGPLALKAVREEMVRLNWCRTNINRQVGRVKQVFKWAVENEMLPGSVHHALQAVAGLREGKGGARESEPVRPVLEADLLAVLPFLSPHVRAMTELQMFTGARSGELCILRTCDIDRSGRTWAYHPPKHKTRHKGKSRVIHFGPKAREILEPFLKADLQAMIFNPHESEEMRLAELRKNRKTPVQPSQVKRGKLAAKRAAAGKAKRRAGRRYTPAVYRRAIERACEHAFEMPAEFRIHTTDKPEEKVERAKKRIAWHREHRFHPHRIRHLVATQIRQRWNLETASAVLGHSGQKVTEVYAERSADIARDAMEKVG